MTKRSPKDAILDMVQDQMNYDNVLPTATFKELGADSLDVIEIVISVEDHFGMSISDAQANALVTVQDLITIVEAFDAASTKSWS